MLGNLAQFNADIDNFARKIVPKKAAQLQTKIALEALRRIAEKTPVRTGRAKGNWIPTIGSPAPDTIESFDKTKSGSMVVARGRAILTADRPPFSTVYITNNVNYIEYLEEGSSKQAPAGMVGITIMELQQMNFGGEI